MPKKRKNSKGNELEELKWELRKRGVRPTGSQQAMAKKLEELKKEEEKAHQSRIMNNNTKRGGKSPKPSSSSDAEPDGGPQHITNSVHNRGEKVRQESGDSGGSGSRKVKKTSSSASTSMSSAPHGGGVGSGSEDRAKIVLWRRPFTTLYYFVREIPCSIVDARDKFAMSLYDPRKRSIPLYRRALILLGFLGILYGLYFMLLKEDPKSLKIKEDIAWYSYWVFLGILSSVGLGTGLHTFLLYLGPFIAKVTLAAQECKSVQFPSPPYPDQVLCPDAQSPDGVTVSDIIGKIRWESLMWGFGTALGELPPYFMARAARISGMADDEDLEEFNQLLQRKKRLDPSKLSLMERGKFWMEDLVEKVGFWGILACASIPNPLFDLAGITCGHFLVPFTTFFGATVIGKAVVKVHLQMTFVILAFNEELLKSVVQLLHSLPKVGPIVSGPFEELMAHQKATLHNRQESDVPSEGGMVASILEKFVMGMVIYFVISIINAMAQSYHKRMVKERTKVKS